MTGDGKAAHLYYAFLSVIAKPAHLYYAGCGNLRLTGSVPGEGVLPIRREIATRESAARNDGGRECPGRGGFADWEGDCHAGERRSQ